MLSGVLLASLLAFDAGAQPAPGDLRLPVPATCISSPFGQRNVTGPKAAPMHTGIDLPAAAGSWVQAAASGRVVALRRSGALGLEIDIQHAGYLTRYAHLGTAAPAFATGKRDVAAGERIGRIGRTGVSYGTHLHFEVRVNGIPVDAAAYFSLQRCG
jgi:murein DD-endopeptidase MepM/ murein hydrolase activator NlpD